MRLQKYMAECGVASRRASEQLILEGRVTVNGITVTELGTKVNEGDKVQFDGVTLNPPKKKVYIMLYKPDKVMSTVSDPEGRKTVLDLVDEKVRLIANSCPTYVVDGRIKKSKDKLCSEDCCFNDGEIHAECVICKRDRKERKYE